MLAGQRASLRLAGVATTPTPAGTLEAESATVVGATIASGSQGNTGTGWVGNWGSPGQYVEFAVVVPSAGSYLLTFRHRRANAGNATRDLTVDGTSVGTVTFASNAADWAANSWSATSTAVITVAAGTRLIRLNHPGPAGDNFIDLDNMKFEVTTTPPPPPPAPGTANFRQMFLDRYPAGAGRWWVDVVSGNDANNGTSTTTPKATIQAAVALAGTGGGIITVRGTSANPYTGCVDMNGRNQTSTTHLLIMAEIGHTPYVRSPGETGGSDPAGGQRTFLMRGCKYVAVYGLEVKGYDIAGFSTGDCFSHRDTSDHVAIWKCNIHDGTHGVGAAGNQGGPVNHWDVCYSRVSFCGKYLAQAASGISFYQFHNNAGGADDANGAGRGYSCYLVGNVGWENLNAPGTAMTDGNFIIIDDWKNTQNFGDYGQVGVPCTNKAVLFNNLGVYNGGRGVHAFSTPTCHILFNTVAHNMRTFNDPDPNDDGNQADLSMADSGGRVEGNISCPLQNRRTSRYSGQVKWLDDYLNSGVISNNIVLRGSDPNPATYGTNNRQRQAAAEGYFVNAVDSLATDTQVQGWIPDGGGGVVERWLIGTTDYTNLSYWPDFFGRFRPTDRNWAIGCFEPGAVT